MIKKIDKKFLTYCPWSPVRTKKTEKAKKMTKTTNKRKVKEIMLSFSRKNQKDKAMSTTRSLRSKTNLLSNQKL